MNSFISILSIYYAFQMGISNHGVALWDSPYAKQHEFTQNLIESRFDVKLNIWYFYLGGSMYTPAICNSFSSYSPVKNTYELNVGFNYKCFSIGYEHYCTHPTAFTNYKTNDLSYLIEGKSDQFFIKISNTFKF